MDGSLGLCQCGCGNQTKLASRNLATRGYVKGKPLLYLPGHRRRPALSERLWGRVEQRGPDECWIWRGSLDRKGYGHFRGTRAHRIAWKLTHGPIPEGLWVLHRCDNPPCCNPAHLFLGTHDDNMRDMVKKGRAIPPHGEHHHNAKLNAAKVREIRKRVAAGETRRTVAADLGVQEITVGNVVRGKSWKHVA